MSISLYLQAGGPFDVKEATEAWRNLTQPGGCYPYDPAAMAMYPYGPGWVFIWILI